MRVTMDKMRIGMIAVVLVAGVSGGMSLAHFATGGIAVAASGDDDKPYMPDNSASYYGTEDGTAPVAPEATQVASAAPDDAMPQHYDCTGCGPTLAERRADYGAGTGGPADDGSVREIGDTQPDAPIPPPGIGSVQLHPGPR